MSKKFNRRKYVSFLLLIQLKDQQLRNLLKRTVYPSRPPPTRSQPQHPGSRFSLSHCVCPAGTCPAPACGDTLPPDLLQPLTPSSAFQSTTCHPPHTTLPGTQTDSLWFQAYQTPKHKPLSARDIRCTEPGRHTPRSAASTSADAGPAGRGRERPPTILPSGERVAKEKRSERLESVCPW